MQKKVANLGFLNIRSKYFLNTDILLTLSNSATSTLVNKSFLVCYCNKIVELEKNKINLFFFYIFMKKIEK